MEEKLFKIEKLRDGNMSQSGKSALRFLNGKELNKVNILIREVLQNSLDARNDDAKSVKVEIKDDEFDNEEFAKLFEEIDDRLVKMFGKKSNFISFKDSNTKGLTGPIHKGEDRKNNDQQNERLINLVYSLGAEQTQAGSGGSWGYGKTALFNFGKGLVVFYSRIKENDEYKSRLICEVIENDNKKESEKILGGNKNSRYKGIAWFGNKKVYDYEDGSRENSTIPLTNEDDINKVLNIFGVEPYIGTETGTTTIIPYIDGKKILKECNEDEDDVEVLRWFQEIETDYEILRDYIEVCISRWYTFRLNNENLTDVPMLEVYYNGEKYENQYEEEIFTYLKFMYNLAKENKSEVIKDGIIYHIKDVIISKTHKVYKLNAGKYIYAEIPKKKFYNSPFKCIFDKENESDKDKGLNKIGLYCRKPAMISNYECKGKWVEGITKLNDEDSYFIGLFVLNSNEKIYVQGTNIKIEEFVRGLEDAVHAEWEDSKTLIIKEDNAEKEIDISKYKLIKWIRDEIKLILKDSYGKEEKVEGTSLSGIAKEFSSLLLPKSGFGRAAEKKKVIKTKTEGESSGGSSSRGGKIVLQKLRILDDSITKELELYISSSGMKIIPKIVMDKPCDLEKFYKELNSLPIEIIGLKINRIVYKNGEGIDLDDCFVKEDNEEYNENQIYIKANKMQQLDKIVSFDIKKDNKQIEHLEGYIEYKFNEKEYNVTLEKGKIEKEEENNE